MRPKFGEVTDVFGELKFTLLKTLKNWVYRRALDYTLVPPLDLYVLLTRTAPRLGRRVEADVFIPDYDARGGDPSAIESWRQRRTGSDP